jgi:hypothetical protein
MTTLVPTLWRKRLDGGVQAPRLNPRQKSGAAIKSRLPEINEGKHVLASHYTFQKHSTRATIGALRNHPLARDMNDVENKAVE